MIRVRPQRPVPGTESPHEPSRQNTSLASIASKNELRHYAAGWVSTGTAVTPTQFYLAEATNDGAASLFRVDGVNRTTSSTPTGTPGTIHLGGSGAFPAELLNGDMAEVIVYDRALTNRERNRVGMYLQDKYGIAGGYNLALGERRATAAKNFLVSLGIAASRLTTISYGKERPIVLGHTAAAWAQNRAAITSIN